MRPVTDIPWWTLTCAYGTARRVPRLVHDLESPSEVVWQNAAFDGIWSALCHQGSLCSATPYAIPYLAQAACRAVPDCRVEIFTFLKACAERDGGLILPSPLFPLFWVTRLAMRIPRLTVRRAIVSCHTTFRRFASDQDQRIREVALWLDNYCSRNCQPAASPRGYLG
jgi:hypothetical protein